MFGEQVATHDAPALAFAGHLADPIERVVGRGVARERVPVFDPIPYPERVPGEFVADILGVVDGVPRHANLEPPVAAPQVLGLAALFVKIASVGVLHSPVRRREGRGTTEIARPEVDGIAHGVTARLTRRVGLAEFLATLATHAPLAAGEVGHKAIARAVDEEFGSHHKFRLGIGNAGDDGRDPPLRRTSRTMQITKAGVGQRGARHAACARELDRNHGGVKTERKIGRGLRGVVEHEIPYAVGPAVFENRLVVACPLLDEQFGKDSRLPRVGMKCRRAVRRHPHLGRAITPEHRSVVEQAGFRALAGGGERRAKAGEAAAADDDIEMFGNCFQVGEGCTLARPHGWRANRQSSRKASGWSTIIA